MCSLSLYLYKGLLVNCEKGPIWVTPGKFSSDGNPRILKISSSCINSEVPGKRGALVNNSAKKHPTDHISMEVVYSLEPNKSSGALYQSVTTLFV